MMKSTNNPQFPSVPSGVINLYKEKGFTSFDAIAVARGILHERRIGHMGTLDPMAEGVLPLMVGNATSLAELFSSHDKCYETEIRFGSETDTQDSSGKITKVCDYVFDENNFKAAVLSFVGPYKQLPPMYSAKKVGGRKLVDLARKGREVERKVCDVRIDSIEILGFDNETAKLRVVCSAGTYIRTLAEDIGKKCGYLAHMSYLKRIRLGNWSCDSHCYKLSEIEEMYKKADYGFIEPLDRVVSVFPSITVPDCDLKYLVNGNKLTYARSFLEHGEANENGIVRMLDSEGIFRALYKISEISDTDSVLHLKAYKMFTDNGAGNEL